MLVNGVYVGQSQYSARRIVLYSDENIKARNACAPGLQISYLI